MSDLNLTNNNPGKAFFSSSQQAAQKILQQQSIVNIDKASASDMLVAMKDGYIPGRQASSLGSANLGGILPANIAVGQSGANTANISTGEDSQVIAGGQVSNQSQIMMGFGFAPASYRVHEYTPPPVTHPPITHPPVTNPPVTPPPYTPPPTTLPPVTNPPVTTPPASYFTWPCINEDTGEEIYAHISTHKDYGYVEIDGQNAYFSIAEFNDVAGKKFNGFPPNGKAGVIELIKSGELARIPTAANGLPDAPENPAIEGEDYITQATA